MRAIGVIVVLLLALSPAHAQTPKAAVFDFELADSSLEGEKNGPRTDEQARLLLVSDQLRKGLADSGQFEVLDIAPVRAEAHNSNLQACGGCDVQYAQRLNADLAITGVVHKVSTLILNMTIFVRNARTGHLITAANADFRSNSDESWSRTASFLLRNRLLEPNFGVPK
ncbi:DUF3280 domain-containing protein [Tardiphaga sp.]|uniref:DUF3280 domain-containing protein n=1 Tax=Tardiphaga sp. TaxID=1926292 RepID=UPI00260FFEA1|nr:DUF3280 domain-containing protein [Tardiphaga sp.]MDB5619380.1 hypothetical protein [Tardiphaga sp.]